MPGHARARVMDGPWVHVRTGTWVYDGMGACARWVHGAWWCMVPEMAIFSKTSQIQPENACFSAEMTSNMAKFGQNTGKMALKMAQNSQNTAKIH